MMDIFTTITYFVSSCSDFSDSLPLIAWLLFARKQKPYTLLGFFFAFSAITKITTYFLANVYVNTMPAYHLLATVEIVMIYCFYARLTFGKINWWIAGLLLAFNIANTVFIQHLVTGKGSNPGFAENLLGFNSIAWTVDMMVIMVICMVYLFRLYQYDDDHTPLEQRAGFIITTGWIIYAAGSIFTYLLGTSILSGTAEGFYHNAWIFQCVCNIVKNIIISYGLWRAR